MLSSNYTVSDLFGSFLCVVLFIPVLLAPGYVVGWWANCFGFRTFTAPWRFLASLPLSVGFVPIAIYWLGSWSWALVWLAFALVFVAWIALLLGAWDHESPRHWGASLKTVSAVGWAIPAIWLVVALFSLVDLQIGHRLYFSSMAYDYSMRTAITDAVIRAGARPNNPFDLLGGPSPLRYHYFWYLPCSLVQRLTGTATNARDAMIASAVWCGWSLIALVPLYFRCFLGVTGSALKRRSLIGIALFAVTGLDLLPTAFLWSRGIVYPDMEWWNEQVTSWWGTVLWVPHHAAGLVAGLAGFLLIWNAALKPLNRQRIVGGLLAGVAFATCVGASIYVAFVFVVFLLLWTVIVFLKGLRRFAFVLVIAGLLTVVLTVPYLKSLAGPGAGGSFVRPTIRKFMPLNQWHVTRNLEMKQEAVLRLVLLPLNYFLELGFFLVAGLVYLRNLRKRGSPSLAELALIVLAATSIFICTFLRSGVITNNDLGWRGFLPAQFALLLWAAELFARRGQTFQSEQVEDAQPASRRNWWWLRSPLWAPLLLLGLAGTAYDLVLFRVDGLLADKGTLPLAYSPDRQLGARTYHLRRAYDQLRRTLPRSGVVQNNPSWNYLDFFYGLYAHRQTLAYEPSCGAEFGGDPKICAREYPAIDALFEHPEGINASQVESLCRRLGIDAIILKDLDPAWNVPDSWAYQLKPAIANSYGRIYLFPRLDSKSAPKAIAARQ